MKSIRQLLRLMTINLAFLRHGLDEFIFALKIFSPIRFVYYLLPWNWFRKHKQSRAVRLRLALEDLGPIFIKFGQMLSTRRDLLPGDIAVELAKLQDRVPPFPNDQAKAIIEQALGKSVNEVFSRFEAQPLASASIAQVHAAELQDGRKVVIKVVRPNIEKIIRRDIELLYIIARAAHRYWPEGRRLRPLEVVEEYEKTIFDELDLTREAANASQLKRDFQDSELLYIPGIEWDLTSQNVFVMERISGIPVGDMDALRNNNVNMRLLAERGVEIFFTQVFRNNFFHADMHPGNIFVDAHNPAAPSYIAIDFGIVGSLTPEDQRYLAENFYAFFRRDYRRVAELHVESGWVPADTRVNDFEAAIRTVCEPIFERPLKEISFGHFLLRLFQTARRFNMEVQPQLVLLQKTLLNIEGLGRDLYPDLDLWKTAKPFIEDWMHDQVGVRALFKGLKNHLPKFLEKAPEAPILLNEILSQAAKGKLKMQYDSQQLEKLERTIREGQRKQSLLLISALLIITGILITIGEHHISLISIPLPAWFAFFAGGISFWASLRNKAK
ncbi:MAG: ubiquinone biosynthesis regulatory protein kinase UbiB [Thiotrichales bacterium]